MCDGPGIADGACDCDGNVSDECGVCGGDGTSCTFSWNQSQVQSFYYFDTASLAGLDIDESDWIVAINP